MRKKSFCGVPAVRPRLDRRNDDDARVTVSEQRLDETHRFLSPLQILDADKQGPFGRQVRQRARNRQKSLALGTVPQTDTISWPNQVDQ